MKESPKRYINPFLSDEENEKVNLWSNRELDQSTVEDHFTPNLQDEMLEKSLTPSNVPLESLEKAKELFVDKNVTECQLPELIACYEERGFQVKDICVDEGHDVNGNKHDRMIEDDIGTQFSKHEQLISSPLEDCYMNNGLSSATEEKLDTEFPIPRHGNDHTNIEYNHEDNLSRNDNEPSNCASDESKLSLESNIVNCSLDKSMKNDEGKLDSGSISLNNSEQLVFNNGVNDVNQQLSEAQGAGSEADELGKTSQTVKISNEIKMNENTSSNFGNMKSVATESPPNHNDMASDNATVANQLQRGSGESSFSMAAGPVSGLITYSGPITASGSISHRSDGSNTSIGSFAFPILQTEWNSSPVRMAKVDHRRSRKHRGWMQALICCRF